MYQDIYFIVSKKMFYVLNFMVFVTVRWKLIQFYVIFELLLKRVFFVNLLCGKAKVAPLKKTSIPRLELLSCVLLAKLLRNVKNAINKNFERANIFYWRDSETSLYWIWSIEKEWKQWVENRVNFIRNFIDYKSWYYVSTKVNPADLPTQRYKIVTNNYLYWHGAKFLLKNSENLPIKKIIDINEECKNEYYPECTTNLVKSVNSKNNSCFIENVIKIGNFSSLKKLFRVTCYALLSMKNLLTKLESDKEKIISWLFLSMKCQKQNGYGYQVSRRTF